MIKAKIKEVLTNAGDAVTSLLAVLPGVLATGVSLVEKLLDSVVSIVHQVAVGLLGIVRTVNDYLADLADWLDNLFKD